MVTALLDSGANCTVISEDLVEKLGLNRLPSSNCRMRIKTASGEAINAIRKMELEFEYTNRTVRLPTLILPQLATEIILGYDFWEAFNITPQINELEIDDVPKEYPLSEEHDLAEDQRRKLMAVVESMPFSEPNRIGKTHVLQHTIDTGDATPFRKRAHVISPYMEQKVSDEIERMLRLDVIEPSDSAWNNPMVAAIKPNGKIRYCLDAKELNACTKRDGYPLSNINRILSRLPKMRFLSSIDLSDAFWQVELREADRDKTSFTVPGRGFFRFKRMPFGLVNSASTLSRIVDQIVGDLEPHVFPYLDDFIIASETFEHQVQLIAEVAKRLRAAGLTVSKEKSMFCRRRLAYVGYLLDENGCRPNPAKTKAVMDFPRPTSVKEVRTFYGMCSWYRRFIADFATITAPLTDLCKTKVKGKFIWNERAEAAFTKMKECLTTAPVLAMPRLEGQWILETDASDTGMGGCLKQVQDGKEHVIVYYSKKLSKAQQKYQVMERECLAVITFMEKSRPYIEGAENVRVISDNASLQWLRNLKDPTGRLARWALRMQPFQYSIVHRSGKKNVTADALSRAIALIEVSPEDQSTDADYIQLMKAVREKPALFPMYRWENELLYRKIHTTEDNFNSQWRIYVPKALRPSVLQDCHDSQEAAHGGLFKTLARVRQDYYWPKMKADVMKHLRGCETCKLIKPNNKNARMPMGEDRVPPKKFRVLCIDFIGPMPTSSLGNNWALVCVDHFTKLVTVEAMRRATAEKTIQVLHDRVFTKYGAPETIILDNGSQLRSKVFQEFAHGRKINLWYTANYHAQANPAEATNHSIIKAIRAYLSGHADHKKWDKDLQMLAWALNSSTHTATKVTPHMAVFGEHLARLGHDHHMRVEEEDSNRSNERFQHIQAKIQAELERAYDARTQRYNLRSRTYAYKVGDVVYKRKFKLSNAANSYMAKLDHQFEPVQIVEIVGNNCYRLMNTNGKLLAGTYSAMDLKE